MLTQKDVSQKIKHYRKLNHLSQEDLANRSGIHVSTIKKYECGIRNPKPTQLMKIADALGISSSELLSFELSDHKEIASLFVNLHRQGLIKMEMKTNADGSYIPESISVSSLSPETQKAIAQVLQNKADAVTDEPTADVSPKKEKSVQKTEPVQKKEPVPKPEPVQKEESVQKPEPAQKKEPAPKPEPVQKKEPAKTIAAKEDKPEPIAEEKVTPPAKKSPAPESLNGLAGTGKAILENMELFRFNFDSTMKFNGQVCLTYDWEYERQGGLAIIRTAEDGSIEDTSTLTCKKNKGLFRQPLSVKRDASLYEVFEKMLAAAPPKK